MEVTQVNVSDVIPYIRNPRDNKSAIAKVAASIKEFGWRQPIVVDETNTIIVGHTRLEAARQLGISEVPVHVANGLTESQIKAYRLADNRTGEDASWDMDLLAVEIADLGDIDPLITGFEQDEIDKILALGDIKEGLTDEDDVPDVPETPVTVLGDIWILGKHRLVCGDSSDSDTVAKCLNGVEPHLMVTDPPYGVEYDPMWRAAVNHDGPNSKRAFGKVDNDDRADWREVWALFPGNIAYVWHGGLHSGAVAESLQVCGFALRAQIIWEKQKIVFGRGDYHWQHEPCWYAVKGTGNWAGDRKQSTIWKINNLNNFARGRESESENAHTHHGTQKPVECMRRPIENNSSPGQAIYEPFNGSGTTIIAAETTGRSCHAIEISPAYVDVAIKRWQDYTGNKAIHEATGEPFNG